MVLDWVERELATGRLALGGRLPGERALADELKISRPALREGLRVLEALGVLRSAVGSGPSSGTVIVAEPEVPLSSALRLHLATDHLSSGDIVETRVLLETWAAGRGGGDPAALQTAERLLGEMEDPALAPGEFLERDAQFHVALTAAAGNALISAMMASIRHSIRSYTLELAGKGAAWDETAKRLRAEHRGILAAAQAGNGTEAADLLRRHIERYYREPAG
jgi:GntR family transcriptional repressor for pyruvate dehydrogenase complex